MKKFVLQNRHWKCSVCTGKEELKALRKKERDYPKQFRQPPVDVNSDTKYHMKYRIFYEKNCHKKINALGAT